MTAIERESIRSIFRGYRHLNSQIVRTLQKHGLTVTQAKNHVLVRRKDGIGNIVTLPSSPSDYRSGQNAFHLVVRLIEMN